MIYWFDSHMYIPGNALHVPRDITPFWSGLLINALDLARGNIFHAGTPLVQFVPGKPNHLKAIIVNLNTIADGELQQLIDHYGHYLDHRLFKTTPTYKAAGHALRVARAGKRSTGLEQEQAMSDLLLGGGP